jgi:hypothetical protein
MALGKVALGFGRETLGQQFGHDERDDPVAEELEPLEISSRALRVAAPPERGMREGRDEQFGVGEAMAQGRFQLRVGGLHRAPSGSGSAGGCSARP